MRLLLRASAHQRAGEGHLQIAASPDTLHREPWQWDLRLLEAGEQPDAQPSTTVGLARSDGSTSRLAVDCDPEVVSPDLQLLDLGQDVELERDAGQLLAFVVGRGVVLVEDRHVLNELDALVFAGDDPRQIRVRRLSDEQPSVAMVRLSPAGAGSLAWVP